jgi:hypothetical protein
VPFRALPWADLFDAYGVKKSRFADLVFLVPPFVPSS